MAGSGGCWNDLCIASDCDGSRHVDATGHCWSQPRGWEFCPACNRYVDPDQCIHLSVLAENARIRALRGSGG